MLTSLALAFFVGLALAALCQKLKLPRIIGMLATGILLGPCVLNVLDGSILSISADLRKLALVIILLKAGLSLDLGDLKKVGRPAILMSCLPATCEIIGYVLLAPYFLGVTRAEAAVMGAVLAAVNFVRLVIQYPGNQLICLTVTLALFATVVIAKTVGGVLPMAAKLIHADPAIMAAPLITTIVDALSLMIYFAIAKQLLPI
jgi:Kef-type K+ transport system membrane component KefB